MAILIFFIAHWQLSVFMQSFFLHRYGAHRQFTMSKRWERFFHICTYLVQGSSYLSPRGWILLHRMHHAYSDTTKDPHSPTNFKEVFSMMWATKKRYFDLRKGIETPEDRFLANIPQWETMDRIGCSWASSLAWMATYTLFYVAFATHAWMFLLLPAHFMMGPIHGAIVNWGGHKYGYRNFEVSDVSRNTLPFDFLTMGELFQNNHHKFANSPNFAARWFEIDPAYPVIRLFGALKIIDLRHSQMIRYPAKVESPQLSPSVSSLGSS